MASESFQTLSHSAHLMLYISFYIDKIVIFTSGVRKSHTCVNKAPRFTLHVRTKTKKLSVDLVIKLWHGIDQDKGIKLFLEFYMFPEGLSMYAKLVEACQCSLYKLRI